MPATSLLSLLLALPSLAAAPRIARAPVYALRGVSTAARVAAFRQGLDLSASLIPGPVSVPPAAPPTLGSALETLSLRSSQSLSRDRSGLGAKASLDRFFLGESRESGEGPSRVNDEGVNVFGRAAAYYDEVRRLVEKLEGRLDLSESLDVMDDSYGDVWAKLKAVERVARSREIGQENTHLEETLTWVDAVLTDGKRKIAVNTHRVYFHHAKNPASEIAEGIRRVDRYVDDALRKFEKGGKAEAMLGPLDEVVLAFDAHGYPEIKAHLQERAAALPAPASGRVRFVFLDELIEAPKTPESMRAELNALVTKYRGKGLEKIIEGVIYSRYVGLVLELTALDHLLAGGWTILQSGREIFDREGHYSTELDVVGRSPKGKVTLVEAKSARVRLDVEEVLAEKVLPKLDTYSRDRVLIDEAVGEPFEEVLFVFDVGGPSTLEEYGKLKKPTRSSEKALELALYLKSQEAWLTKKYGFPVRFLFLKSGPELLPPGKKD